MIDTVLSYLLESIRKYTAFRAWFAEVLLLFAVLTLVRIGAAVWDGAVLGNATYWVAWWAAYDSIGSFADDSVALAIALTALMERVTMFLAKKRFRIIREDSLEEGKEIGREEGLEEGRSESAAAIQELRAEIRRLRNGANGADGANQANSQE
jgi:hypothetical protein